MKKILSIILCFILLTSCLTGCKNNETALTVDDTGATQLSFITSSLKDVMGLDGQKVTITGYMSILTPLDGKIVYLVNLPLQSCPFCAQNSQELSTSMAVVFNNNIEEVTDQPIKVVGTLKVGDFEDDYGYKYSYRIENASYQILDESVLPEGYDVYYTLSANNDIYTLYYIMSYVDYYVYFDYYEMSVEDILKEPPVDLDAAGYFDSLNRVQSYKDNRYSDYIEILKGCKTLETEINKCLQKKDTTTLKTLQPIVDELYNKFNSFITKYSL